MTESVKKIYTVAQLTREIRFTLEDKFGNVWVEGEISGFLRHTSGHMYFTLKDGESSISCVMFRGDNGRLKFTPENGQKVLCGGRVTVYAARGQYQLTLSAIEPQGVGALQLAFEQLKKKLAGEGLFDNGRKRPIPYMPQCIGIVTSPTGAVIHDIQHVLSRRFSECHLVIRPTKVQGEGSKEDIVQAIKDFNEYGGVNVIILARGGGSLEDLWAFNEEIVARAIANSEIPIISAVGHEVDFTIADFVADLRAPTPSAAAEIVLPLKEELENRITDLRKRLTTGLRRLGEDMSQRIDDLTRKLGIFLSHPLEVRRERLRSLEGRLEALSPTACLKRGYSIAFDAESGRIIKSTSALKPGRNVRTRLHDGEFTSQVTDVQ